MFFGIKINYAFYSVAKHSNIINTLKEKIYLIIFKSFKNIVIS